MLLAETLLSEAARPFNKMNKDKLLKTVEEVDASDVDSAPMIYFSIESLLHFTQNSEFPISKKELLKAILTNPTLYPILFQNKDKLSTDDKEIEQMLSGIKAFLQ